MPICRRDPSTVFVSEFMLTSIGLDFARQADAALNDIEDGLRTRLYYASPRVFTVSSIGAPNDVVTTTVDLRHTSVEAVVYPGQASAAEQVAQWIKGLTNRSSKVRRWRRTAARRRSRRCASSTR